MLTHLMVAIALLAQSTAIKVDINTNKGGGGTMWYSTWWFWVLVHIAYLAGFRNRLSVMLEWAYAYFTFRPGARLITEEEHSLSRR